MKSLKKNIIIVIVIIAVVLYLLLRKEFNLIMAELADVHLGYFSIAILCVIAFWLLEAKAVWVLIRQNHEGIKYGYSFLMTLATQFFNGITPFASGGQPMQVYYMKKKGVSVPVATNICVQSLMIHQIALVAINVVMIIYQTLMGTFSVKAGVAKRLMWFGFLVNVAVLILFYAVSYFPKFNKFISHNLLSFLHRIRLVRDLEKRQIKMKQFFTEFHDGSEKLLDNKVELFKAVGYTLLKLAFFNVIIYFTFRSIGVKNAGFITSFMCSISVISVATVVPSPGASGGVEYAFLMFFGVFYNHAQIVATMMLWRFITYYLGLIVGFVASLWLDRRRTRVQE